MSEADTFSCQCGEPWDEHDSMGVRHLPAPITRCYFNEYAHHMNTWLQFCDPPPLSTLTDPNSRLPLASVHNFYL